MLIPVEAGKFVELTMKKKTPIRELVESHEFSHVVRKAFSSHSKSETISMKRTFCFKKKSSGHLYEGKAVRKLLGLTKGSFDWNIQPSNFDSCISEFFNRIFVYSTLVN